MITDEDLFFSFFFPYNISRASKNTWTHAEERSTMKISYKFKPPAASVSTIEKKILQGEDDTG